MDGLVHNKAPWLVMRHKYNEKVLSVHISSIHPSIHPSCMVCWWVLLVGTMWLVGWLVGTPGVAACHVPGAKPTYQPC